MSTEMVILSSDKWRLWVGLGLSGIAGFNAVLGLSIAGYLMTIFLAVSVLMVLVGLIQFSLWSKSR